METQFSDRVLTCSDCRSEFVFTAGEQLFFHEKQFKNDPKRCKACKSRRSGVSSGNLAASGASPAAAGLSRTETRTECSECGIETTVPFKPTQGRPVLCRQCYQNKHRIAAASAQPILHHDPLLDPPAAPVASMTANEAADVLTSVSANAEGQALSAEAALLAAVSMTSASSNSSVASLADLESITGFEADAQPSPGVILGMLSSQPEPALEPRIAAPEALEV